MIERLFECLSSIISNKCKIKKIPQRIIKVLVETARIERYMSNDKLLIYKGSV